MPKENDLEGRQDMGGKHGGQAGMPKPEGESSAQQGIVTGAAGREQGKPTTPLWSRPPPKGNGSTAGPPLRPSKASSRT